MKHLVLALLVVALSLGLTACDPDFKTVCATASAATKVMTIASSADKVSTNDLLAFKKAKDLVKPICEAETEPTSWSAAAKLAFADAVGVMTSFQAKYAIAAAEVTSPVPQ